MHWSQFHSLLLRIEIENVAVGSSCIVLLILQYNLPHNPQSLEVITYSMCHYVHCAHLEEHVIMELYREWMTLLTYSLTKKAKWNEQRMYFLQCLLYSQVHRLNPMESTKLNISDDVLQILALPLTEPGLMLPCLVSCQDNLMSCWIYL